MLSFCYYVLLLLFNFIYWTDKSEKSLQFVSKSKYHLIIIGYLFVKKFNNSNFNEAINIFFHIHKIINKYNFSENLKIVVINSNNDKKNTNKIVISGII